MTKVKDVLRNKDGNIWSISPNASVFEGLEMMAEKNIGALVVLEAGKLCGIFSERDYARKVILKGRTSRETPIEALMTREVISTSPEADIQHCMVLMTTNHIRHLPVMEGNHVTGVLSIGDVVKTIITEQEVTIHELENYITGKNYGV